MAAFGRRRSRGNFRRRFGKPFAKQGTMWVTTLFNEVASDSATVVELVMMSAGDVDLLAAVDTAGTIVYHIRRIIVNATFLAMPSLAVSNVSDQGSIVWAIYTLDTEDSDNTILNTNAGSILRTERILQTGIVGWGAHSITTGQSGGGVYAGIPVNVDFRLPVKMRSDELLLFGFQQQSAFGTAFGVQPSCSAITRILVNQT